MKLIAPWVVNNRKSIFWNSSFEQFKLNSSKREFPEIISQQAAQVAQQQFETTPNSVHSLIVAK